MLIVPREFAPIPHNPAGFPIPMAMRMRFLRHDRNLSVRCGPIQNQPWGGTVPPPVGRPRAQVQERVGRTTLFSSSAMSSGRLFLDRVGRHQSLSPLHRHGQNNSVARSEGTNYHRTVSSVLTVCVSSGGRRNLFGPQLVGGLAEVPSKSRHSVDVTALGFRRVVAKLQLLQHSLP